MYAAAFTITYINRLATSFLLPASDCVHCLGQICYITRSDTRNRNAAVCGAVDVKLIAEASDLRAPSEHIGAHHNAISYLLGSEAGVAEHAGLVGDVLPRQLGACLLKMLAQRGAHADNAAHTTQSIAQYIAFGSGYVTHYSYSMTDAFIHV